MAAIDWLRNDVLNSPSRCRFRNLDVQQLDELSDEIASVEDDLLRLRQAFQKDPPSWAMWPDMGMHGDRCGDCGAWCTVVRPGKTQCDYCHMLGYVEPSGLRGAK
jgi:hypothetical protein